MFKKVLTFTLALALSLGAYAQEKMYLIKGNEVVAKYNVGDVDYATFHLPEGVIDNTGDGPTVNKKQYGHSCISPWQYNHVIQRS